MAPTTFKTVEAAAELAYEIEKSYKLLAPISKKELHDRVYNWYCHSDVTDITILASSAVCSDYFSGATYNDMLKFTELWFPEDPTAETPIWEIEAAERDTLWH